MGVTTFHCPRCGELLEYAHRHDSLILLISTVSAVILAFYFGYRGLTLFFVAIGATLLILFLVGGVRYQIWPPKAQQPLRKNDTGFHLTDKPHR